MAIMARQKEGILSRNIIRILRSRGHYVWKNHGNLFTEAGIPDVIGYRLGDGVFIGLEVKINESLSAVQRSFIQRCQKITNAKACIAVVRSTDEAIAYVEKKGWINEHGNDLHKLRKPLFD